MKNIIRCMILAVIVMLVFCGCDKTETKTDAGAGNMTPASNQTGVPVIEESLSEKLTRELDGAYSEEEKLPENSTNGGIVALADRYAEKWQQVAQEHYDKLMEQPSYDLHTYVANMKENWEQYYAVQCENYHKTLEILYSGGTMAAPIFAIYKKDMQREWALQLVDIYQQMNQGKF